MIELGRRIPLGHPALLGALLGCLLLADVAAAPTTHIAGTAFLDGMGTQWFFAYPGWVLAGITDLEHTDLLFYPWGKEVFLHTGGNLLDAALAAPLRAIFGPILGYNLWVVVLCALNGWAAARFAAAWGLRPGAQKVVAVLYVLAPFHLYELEWGRPTQALTAFIPLALAHLRERRGVSAGVLLAAAGWTYWYAGLCAGLAAALLFFWELGAPRRWRTCRTWVTAACVCLVLVAPAAVPMLEALDNGQVPGLLAAADGMPLPETAQGDEQGLFVLSALGQLAVERPGGFEVGEALFGPLAWAAALIGVVVLRKRSVGAVVLVVLGALIASGPRFHFGEVVIANPVYAFLFEHVSLFQRWWWPVRASVLVVLGVAVLAGGAIEPVIRRWPRAWIAALAIGLPWSWGLAPLSSWQAGPTPSLACLATSPAGAVVDLPLAHDQRHLWDQVVHGKPQLGGMLSLKPEFGSGNVDELLAQNAFAEELVSLGGGAFRRGGDEPAGRADLIALGYRYVVVRTQAYERPSSRGTTSDYPRLERALVNRLGPAALRDSEDAAGPVVVWTLDGSELDCD